MAQDGIAAAVTLTYNDRFCLDGQKLRLTSSESLSTYGQDSTTYQTEIANFSNVTAHGQAGAGPAYFSVQGRDGLTYEYGNVNTSGAPSNGSQVTAPGTSTVLQWLLDKVSDRYGNNYVVTYSAPNGAAGVGLPTTIAYTPGSAGSTTYNYTIAFSYSTRASQNPSTHTPTVVGVVAASTISNPNLLNSITVSSSGTTVRQYTFSYTASATTTQALLTGISQCGGSAGTDCLPPTSITYQPGAAGVQTAATTAVSGNLIVLATRDFNGDGRDDILYLNNANNTLYVAFATATGFATPVVVAPYTITAAYGDLLGKGQSDILVPVSNVWWRYTWNGSAFAGSSTGIALDTGVNYAALVDINGDGLPDLITADLTNISAGQSLVIHSRLNMSTSGTLAFANTEAATSLPICPAHMSCFPEIDADGGLNSKLRSLDFNGDGQKDLVVHMLEQSTGHIIYMNYLLISNGTSFAVSTGAETTQPVYVYLNANDDACTDIATGAALSIAPCNGTPGTLISLSGSAIGALDWDGDGRDDILVANGSTLGVIESTGTAGTAIISTGIPYSSSTPPFVFDQNGDGLGDLGFSTPAGGNITYSLHNGAGQRPDLAAAFADGYGVTYSPSYVALSDSTGVYTKGSSAVYPNADYIGSLYVVSSYTSSDGIGGTYQITYSYADEILNLQGRGFQGFTTVTSTDSRTGFNDTRTYSTLFPNLGMLTAESVTQSTGTSVSVGSYTLASLTLDNTADNQRYFPYTASSSVNRYEVQVGGSYNGQLITTVSANSGTPDVYGNFANVVTRVTDEDSGSPYFGQQWTTTTATTIAASPSTWCNSLPTERDVTKTAPGVPAITRHLSFTPDYTLCRETQQVAEAGNNTYQVTTAYGIDAFGNINSQTVTGVGMTARTTGITWGATGQFPVTLTNALNQATHVNFDPNTGQLLSAQDPNGITASWQYDDFARKAKETRPDGTSTTWVYNACGSSCLNGNNKLTVVQTNLNTDGSTLNTRNTYFDSFERILATSKQMLNGAYDLNEVQYDNLGNVLKQGVPSTFAAGTQYWTTNAHDALNRLTSSQRPTSATVSTPLTTSYTYQGRTSTVTDPPTSGAPSGRVSTKISLPIGLLGKTQDNSGYSINFTYDAFGSLLTTIDNSSPAVTLQKYSYAYGINAFKIASTDADFGAWTWVYDALGEVTSYTDAKGQNFSFQYDALSRPTQRTEPDPITPFTFVTNWTWGTSAANFNIGQLQSVTATSSPGTYSEAYTFDSKGRLSTKTIAIPGDTSYTYTSTYNWSGLLDTLQYPVSTSSYQMQLKYAYANGVLQQISDITAGGPGTTYWTANTTNPRGQILQETMGNGVIVNHTFDAVTAFVQNIQAGSGGGAALQNNSYLFDAVGNLTQRQDGNAGVTENVFPDLVYRLDHTVGDTNTQMTYDAMGRIATWGVGTPNVNDYTTPQSGCTYYANSQVHAVRKSTQGSIISTYCYDANGNMTVNASNRWPTETVTWTGFNQPSSINGVSQFFYDANHQRYMQQANYSGAVENTIYIGKLLEKMSNASGTAYRHYIPAGNNTIVYTRTSSGTNSTYYMTQDHLGSTAVITDQTGNSLVKEAFAALGWNEFPTTVSATVSRHAFTGQEGLDNVFMVNMNGRVYSPSGSYFLSPDPHITDPSNPQNYNRYSYVLNNPLTLVDPTGFDEDPTALIGSVQDSDYGAGYTGVSSASASGTYAATGSYIPGSDPAFLSTICYTQACLNSFGLNPPTSPQVIQGNQGTNASEGTGTLADPNYYNYAWNNPSLFDPATSVAQWLADNQPGALSPGTGPQDSGNSFAETLAIAFGGWGVAGDALKANSTVATFGSAALANAVSDFGESLSKWSTGLSVGLDVLQGITADDPTERLIHGVDAGVDFGVSKFGAVGTVLSVGWALSGGFKGWIANPAANQNIEFGGDCSNNPDSCSN